MVAGKVPKFAFCGKNNGVSWIWVLDRVDQTSSCPLKLSFGVGTQGPKVPWVGQVCVLSDIACSRVQSCLLGCIERKILKLVFMEKMCAKIRLSIVPWKKTAKFQKMARKCWKSMPMVSKCWYSARFRVGLVSNEEQKLENLLKKNVCCGVVHNCSLGAKNISLDSGLETAKSCFLWTIYSSAWFGILDGVDWTSSCMPFQTKPWGGTPGSKVPWVRKVCVLSDKACPRVQSGLAVLGKRFWS